ncbi:TonB-dependent receptor [Parapedomonas caeni]
MKREYQRSQPASWRWALLAGSASLLTSVATPVLAAENAEADNTQIGEIIVTAQKREERLQDTPISISAFTADSLQARSMANLNDLSSFTPNLEINTGRGDAGSSNAAVFIRGVGQYDFIFPTDPGVGIYLDGVYIARSVGGMMDLADVQRIEVLRGPQGTLYGKNTIGGAINIVTSKPSSTLEGNVELTTGSYDRIDARGMISGPLSDTVSAKLSFSSANRDGYGKRLVDGVRTGDIDKDVVRAAINVQPSDNLDILLAADYSRIRQHGPAKVLVGFFPAAVADLYNALGAPYQNAVLGLPADSLFDDRWLTSGDYETNGTGPARDDADIWGVSATIDWQLSDAVGLKSISAYRDMDTQFGVDMDQTPYPIIDTSNDQKQHQFSQEFQFTGTAFEDRLTWLAGLYYFTEKGRDFATPKLMSGLYQALELLPGPLVPLGPEGPFAGGAGNPVNAALDLDLATTSHIKVTNWAGFAQGTYKVTDTFSLTLGARYTWEKKEYNLYSYYPASGGVVMPGDTESKSWKEFTPKLGIDYKPNPDMLFYASYSKGFKSGGWNPRPLTPASFGSYDPEYLTAYEAGFKSQWLDRRLLVNVATFYSRYKDLQLSTNTTDSTGNILLVVNNAGKTDLWGFEAEIMARPAAGLDLSASIGYLDNEYKDLDAGVPWSLDNKLPDAPKWTINLAAQYAFELGDMGALTVRGDAAYKSKSWKDPSNYALIAQPSYWLLNARMTWDSPDSLWSVSVFGTNLTDKYYRTAGTVVEAFGFAEATIGRPREWGLSVKRSF